MRALHNGHLIVKKVKRKRKIGCKFGEQGILAVNSKEEANWMSFWRKSQSTSRNYSPNLCLSKKRKGKVIRDGLKIPKRHDFYPQFVGPCQNIQDSETVGCWRGRDGAKLEAREDKESKGGARRRLGVRSWGWGAQLSIEACPNIWLPKTHTSSQLHPNNKELRPTMGAFCHTNLGPQFK